MIVVAYQRDVTKEGMSDAFLAANPTLPLSRLDGWHAQTRQGQQPAKHIAAHTLRGLAQTVLQPRDIAQFLALKGLGCRIDEAMQFLSPDVYRFVGFFLLSSLCCNASVSRISTYSSANFMNWV